MSGDVTPYLNLITSEHASKPNFVAAMTGFLQPFADLLAIYNQLVTAFDVDIAVGPQLDAVGVRVGVSRELPEPLPNVYFSFGIAGIGFGQGVWKGPFDPLTGLVSLPDDGYRTLIRATIAANQWNGTVEGAYNYWNILLGFVNSGILIQEFSPLEVVLALTGAPDVVTQALFLFGKIDPRPGTIEIRSRLAPSVPSSVTGSYFGFWPATSPQLPETTYIGGFGQGAWGTTLEPSLLNPNQPPISGYALTFNQPTDSENIAVIQDV